MTHGLSKPFDETAMDLGTESMGGDDRLADATPRLDVMRVLSRS